MKVDILEAELYQPYRMSQNEYFIILKLDISKQYPEAYIMRYNTKYSSGDRRTVGFYENKTVLFQSNKIDKKFIQLIFEIDNIVEGV